MDGACAGRDRELAINVFDVTLNGVTRQMQLLGDFTIAQTLRDQAKNFIFTRA